ncbi:MAG: right-handed parallel beta-helix repeat-containing protein [bacterium]|nr:MAG: right-handed parallel beta-helix repeat-containing protein [bacterium]
MQRSHLLAVIIIASCCSLFESARAGTWYVKPDGTGDVPTIEAGIDSAQAGDTVLVAPGEYTWSDQGTGDEYGMIFLTRGVTGFVVRSEAGPEATILNAEGQGRLIYLMGENFVTIEGFTFTLGIAGERGYYCGGGICAHVSAPVIRNCIFTGNSADQGGGMWIGGVSAPRLENCRFINNEATHGGGVFLINSSTQPVFVDCIFDDNRAERYGGGLLAYTITFELEGCAIYRNSAGERGGGFYGENIYESTITRCTISENAAPAGGGIHIFRNSALTVRSSIICYSRNGGALAVEVSSLLDIGCCDIYGNSGGDSFPPGTVDAGFNIFLEPQFCGSVGSANYYLQSDSPCHPINHPGGLFCGLIGAYPVMCGSVPVGEDSWSGIKRSFKR